MRNSAISTIQKFVLALVVGLVNFSLIHSGAFAQKAMKAFENGPNRSQPAGQSSQSNDKAGSMGELEPALSYGNDGPWSGSAEGNAYRLQGNNAPGDIKYFWIGNDDSANGSRTVKVTVDVNSGGMAGLIYGFQENPKRYFLVVVDANDTLRIFERAPDGFEERLSSTFDAKGGPVDLEIRENGAYIDVLVNGQNMIGFGNEQMGQGSVGIAAVETGSYLFSDFALETGKK